LIPREQIGIDWLSAPICPSRTNRSLMRRPKISGPRLKSGPVSARSTPDPVPSPRSACGAKRVGVVINPPADFRGSHRRPTQYCGNNGGLAGSDRSARLTKGIRFAPASVRVARRPEYAETARSEQNDEAATIGDFSLTWFPGSRASSG
jgi:hypothetical protein